MPLYTYACDRHGEFDAFNPMSRAAAPAPCPGCGRAAERRLTSPNVAAMSPIRRDAAARNEKSRHEPKVVTRGCSHTHKPPSAKPQPLTRDGRPALQTYKGPRPWVVEHR